MECHAKQACTTEAKGGSYPCISLRPVHLIITEKTRRGCYPPPLVSPSCEQFQNYPSGLGLVSWSFPQPCVRPHTRVSGYLCTYVQLASSDSIKEQKPKRMGTHASSFSSSSFTASALSVDSGDFLFPSFFPVMSGASYLEVAYALQEISACIEDFKFLANAETGCDWKRLLTLQYPTNSLGAMLTEKPQIPAGEGRRKEGSAKKRTRE